MIEVAERHAADGTYGSVTGLRTAYATIRPVPGAYRVRTCRRHAGAILNGSIRYRVFATYDAALSYALGYARRISAEKREKEAQS